MAVNAKTYSQKPAEVERKWHNSAQPRFSILLLVYELIPFSHSPGFNL